MNQNNCCYCGSIKKYGKCPYGHDGTKCEYCGSMKEYSKCSYGHDGTKCEHCGTFLMYGRCLHGLECSNKWRFCKVGVRHCRAGFNI